MIMHKFRSGYLTKIFAYYIMNPSFLEKEWGCDQGYDRSQALQRSAVFSRWLGSLLLALHVFAYTLSNQMVYRYFLPRLRHDSQPFGGLPMGYFGCCGIPPVGILGDCGSPGVGGLLPEGLDQAAKSSDRPFRCPVSNCIFIQNDCIKTPGVGFRTGTGCHPQILSLGGRSFGISCR